MSGKSEAVDELGVGGQGKGAVVVVEGGGGGGEATVEPDPNSIGISSVSTRSVRPVVRSSSLTDLASRLERK